MREPAFVLGGYARVLWCRSDVLQRLVGSVVRLRYRVTTHDGVSADVPGWATDWRHPVSGLAVCFSEAQLAPIVDPARALVSWCDVPGGRPVLADG